MNILIPSIIVAISVGYISFGGLKYVDAYNLYTKYSYYIVLIGTIIWLCKLVNILPKRRVCFYIIKRHLYPVVLAFFIVMAMFRVSPPDFRILADETNLLSVSQSMYEDHTVFNVTQKFNYNHNFYERKSKTLEKRPLLYPLCVSVLHSFLGYSYKNAFVLNGICMFVSLIVIYFIAVPYWGRFWGTVTMLTLAAFPILVLYTTSAGFDIFNMVWALILIVVLRSFIKYRSASLAEFVLYTSLMLAQTRYESAMAIILVIPFIFYFLPKAKYCNLSLACVVYPFFILPITVINKLTYNSKSLQVDSLEEAFGVGHFFRNIRLSLPFFLGDRYDYGMSRIAAYLTIFACLILIVNLFKGKHVRILHENKALILFVFVFYLLHAFVKFSYYWGNLTLQHASRHGIVFIPIIAFMSAYSIKWLVETLSLKRFLAMLVPVFIAFYGWPAAAQNLAVREISLFREFKSIREYLEIHYPNKKEYLLVTPVANLYVPLNYSVVSPTYFNANYELIKDKINNGYWHNIILVQKLNKETEEIYSESQIKKIVKLQKLCDINQINDNIIRILILTLN